MSASVGPEVPVLEEGRHIEELDEERKICAPY